MTFAYTRPQFCLPFTINGTVTVNFTDLSSTGAITIGSSSTVRYTNRGGDPTVDAWAYLAQEMSTGDAGGTWAASELAGGYQGRVVLTRTPSDGKTVDTVVFSSTTFSNLFGFTTASNGATTNAVTAQSMGYGLWIAHSGADTFLEMDESWSDDAVVITESPDGTSTIDDFGGVTRREIVITQVPAALVYPHYTDEGDWLSSYSGVLSDEQQSWDTLRQQWLLLSDGQACRYSPDSDTPSVFYSLSPGAEDRWIASTRNAAEIETRAPYRFRLTITANEV